MQDALELVRRDLGPDAAVLQARDVRGGGLLRLIPGVRRVEVTASVNVVVPSRMPKKTPHVDLSQTVGLDLSTAPDLTAIKSAEDRQMQLRFRADVKGRLNDLQSMVEDLCRQSQRGTPHDLPPALFHVFTDLIQADVGEALAREMVERVRVELTDDELTDSSAVREQLTRLIEDDIPVAGAINIQPGQRRLVALVGPTGVGKTTTIAKLAANFRLKEQRKVGLITVDTYRIAAVEQLRTYADIIELPMAVVANAREMREAVARMSDLELVLMDTAGRSPRDEVKIEELRTLLAEAEADEVHLVLSSAGSAGSLVRTAEQFAAVGATSLVLTKLDEVSNVGHLLPLVRAARLPLSYLTDGQNVPDDIAPASARRLARMVLDSAKR
jgi:flagellar biosynthesis protein FlhF